MHESILFIDDDELVLSVMKRQFKNSFFLTVAYSAYEAMSLLQGGGQHFEVVVSDVTMPGLNGLDFIELMAPRHPKTSFVVLTGNCDGETHNRAVAIPGVVKVLTKPAKKDEILNAIDEALARNAGSQTVTSQ